MNLLLPTRFQLNPPQVASALELADLVPSAHSGLTDLPSSSGAGALFDAGVLVEGSSSPTLKPEVRSALEVAADPNHSLTIIANRAGRPVWAQATFIHGLQPGPFVVQAKTKDHYDFAFVPSATEATLLVDEMLGVTALQSEFGDASYELDLLGYVTLLAAADALQQAHLEVRLGRVLRRPPPIFTPESLGTVLARGLETLDTRWAVSAAQPATPVAFDLAASRLREGLVALDGAGLVTPVEGGWKFTAIGYALGDSLCEIINTATLRMARVRADSSVVVSDVTMFRTVASIIVATWREVTDTNARLSLFQTSAAGALRLIRGLLEPIGLEEPVVAPEAVHEELAMPWLGTHRVPYAGLPAWDVADANTSPVAVLDPGLEVMVSEMQPSGWAHIVCANGWSAWTDGRQLVEIS